MPAAKSGIPIFLTQESYDSAITKHGQWVRWIRAQTCPCLLETNQVDPTCTLCTGRGKLYSYQKTAEVRAENSPHNLSEVDPANTPILSVDAVRRGLSGEDAYTVDSFSTTEILISATAALPHLPKHYELLEVDYQYSLEQDYAGSATYYSDGRFTVPLDPVRTKSGETIRGEVTTVTQLRNVTKSIDYTVTRTARNELYATFNDPSDEPASTDTITAIVKYLDPQLFILTGVTEKLIRQEPWLANAGEALLVVPYNIDIGVGDLITQLAGYQRSSAILRVSHDLIDELPAFDVQDILRLVDKDREYTKGTDFILWGRNQIKWLVSGARPTEGYSVMFTYHPTFSTVSQKPMVRTGENLRLPRRLGLEAYEKVSSQADASVPVL